MVSGIFKQVIFGALAKKGLRSQGATALVQNEREKPKAEAAKKHCGCMTVVHERVPHPKYGNKVPHFDSKTVRDPNCPHAKAEAERLLSLTPVAAPEAPVPFEMEPEEPEPESWRCTANTKAGTRCKNGGSPDTHRCGVHPL
jgi:hypothetical protein